jgi:hypothetical protein
MRMLCWKIDLNLCLRTELCTRDIGKGRLDMVMEFKNGQMERNMKDYGKIIKHMVKEHFGMWMGISLRASGKMIKQMGMECILT